MKRQLNPVLNLGFRDACAFRPGVILPERCIKSRTTLYRVLYLHTRPLFPLLKRMDLVTTTTELGHVVIHPRSEKRLEVSEITAAA
ncbi:hypothetical protein GGR28_000587 [Lewinella aquimaris]|uniref:Uncharacterized protein n=1 Tax=Neolewinella aquimaris TaxID=1835722 RepID=A0A840EAF9_9BACT|nr:hypothetical protein [Neolewinella aquimaris]MBB4077986.1 hypothetical protein [Neolewinella aquimaris]